MAFNPNAIFLSPSSLADFEKCPQLYYYRNVYRSPRGLKIQTISPALALGQTVHDTLEQFLKLPPTDRSKDELDRIYALIWGNLSGEKGGYTTVEEEAGNKKRGEQMLNRFWANTHFREVEAVKIPNFPKAELGNDLILTGKLDWVEKAPDGLKIVDFKTGKNEEREDSKQMPIYAYLVSKVLNSDKIIACYWYLDKDENLTACSLPDLEKTFAYLKQKGEIIKMVRQTNSFKCQSGGEECWACKDILAVAQGKGKLVTVDPVNRKQEIYILTANSSQPSAVSNQLSAFSNQSSAVSSQSSVISSQSSDDIGRKTEGGIPIPDDLPF